MKKVIFSLFVLVLLPVTALVYIGCAHTNVNPGLPPFNPENVPAVPDYSNEESWLSLPDDPTAYDVDVFWVYPTILTDNSGWLMAIDDAALQAAARRTLTQQAGVFTGLANLYAPLYRQMNMAGLNFSSEEQDRIMGYGKEDVRQALEYYIDHYNRGKPFILAGHSQGSTILTDQVCKRWGKNGWEDRMVAGYLIGWSITEDDLKNNPELNICRSPDQTNCFITYNSVAEGAQPQAPTILPGAVVVNPLTWNTSTDPAPADLNRGAVFFLDDGTSRTYPRFTAARIEDGGLVVDPAEPDLVNSPGSVFPPGVYHSYDYSLFFENLKANVRDRIKAFKRSAEKRSQDLLH